MRIVVGIFFLFFAFLSADFFFGQPASLERGTSEIAFDHNLHGDSLGLDCVNCHTGSRSLANAYLPSKADCMDCHRLPLTENPGIEKLDSVLANAGEKPWKKKLELPEHVVFHHGVHSVAGVECVDCHGSGYKKNRYGGENFRMQSCLQCHGGEEYNGKTFKPAATYCAACHR